jgi:hypothetical protein
MQIIRSRQHVIILVFLYALYLCHLGLSLSNCMFEIFPRRIKGSFALAVNIERMKMLSASLGWVVGMVCLEVEGWIVVLVWEVESRWGFD